MKKLRIAHINMFYLPTFGGVEQVMYELAQRQVKQGHEVHVFCCDSDKNQRLKIKEEVLDSIHVHRFPYWFRLSLSTFIWPSLLWRFGKYGKFDIIHTHVSGHAYILIAGILSKVYGFKHIHTTHCPWTGTEFRPRILKPFIFLNNLFMNKIAFSLINKVIAITPWELDILKKFTDENKIKVIPNGMDSILYKKIKNNQFKKRHKIKEKNMVLFFGRLNPTKGPEVFARSAINLTKSGKAKNIAFVWVGPDEGKAKEVKKLIKGYKNMHYLGPIYGKEKVAEMYQAADVYVLPSYREGLPLTLFEAMASGLPIIASDVGGNNEIVHEGENGYLIAGDDPHLLAMRMSTLIINADIRHAMGNKSREFALAYDWRNSMNRYNELIEKYGK